MALVRNLVLVLSLLVVGPWASVTGLASSLPDAPAIRLCGRRLADLVWMICMDRGGVHSHMDRRAALSPVQRPFVVYRPAPLRRDGSAQGGTDEDGSSSSSSAEAVTTTSPAPPADVTYNRHHSSSHVQSSSGGGGIVEECCRRPCSFATLASYCARPSDGSSLDAFNVIASSGGSASSSLTLSSSSSSEGGQSGMQGDQASSSLAQGQPEPRTTRPPRIASSARLQTAHEVNREHNEVDGARRPGAPSRLTTGRMLPGTAFLTSPEDDTPFSTRPRIGTFSRHRPYWYVVQAAFNGDAEEEGLDA